MTRIVIFYVFVILLKCTLWSGHDVFRLWTWCRNGDIMIDWGTAFCMLEDDDAWIVVSNIFLEWESLRVLMEWSFQLIRSISCIVQLYFLARKSLTMLEWDESRLSINVMRKIFFGDDWFAWTLCHYCISLNIEFGG